MNIYLVKDKDRDLGEYDGFDSFVVIAENETQALNTHPSCHIPHPYKKHPNMRLMVGKPLNEKINDYWWGITNDPSHPDNRYWPNVRNNPDLIKDIEITLLGKATANQSYWHIICVSYNQP